MRFFFRRLRHACFLLFGVSILAFLFTTLAPGNYFDEMRLNPQIAPETMAALRAQYQLDRPLPVRYVSWMNSVLHGQMGFSFAYNSPVAPILFVRARNTLLLTITATLIAWGIALPLGVWSAERFGRLPDRLLSWATAALRESLTRRKISRSRAAHDAPCCSARAFRSAVAHPTCPCRSG